MKKVLLTAILKNVSLSLLVFTGIAGCKDADKEEVVSTRSYTPDEKKFLESPIFSDVSSSDDLYSSDSGKTPVQSAGDSYGKDDTKNSSFDNETGSKDVSQNTGIVTQNSEVSQNAGSITKNSDVSQNTGNITKNSDVSQNTGNITKNSDVSQNTGNITKNSDVSQNTVSAGKTSDVSQNEVSVTKTGTIAPAEGVSQNVTEVVKVSIPDNVPVKRVCSNKMTEKNGNINLLSMEPGEMVIAVYGIHGANIGLIRMVEGEGNRVVKEIIKGGRFAVDIKTLSLPDGKYGLGLCSHKFGCDLFAKSRKSYDITVAQGEFTVKNSIVIISKSVTLLYNVNNKAKLKYLERHDMKSDLADDIEDCDLIKSPLMIDLSSGGSRIALSSPKSKVFDLSNVSNPQQATPDNISWITNNTTYFLALDKNKNGSIDSGYELFGNVNINPVTGKPFENGFEDLAQFDENHDGFINSKDPVFKSLRLWKGEFANGSLSKNPGLRTLTEMGILEIDLAGEKMKKAETDIWGNQTKYRSFIKVKSQNSSGNRFELKRIFDVFFRIFTDEELMALGR
ncbi:MAG: hypothetical protein HQK54_06600 [Oligoflexales bacterium]|nr:hypothetical protein [Oligoflexales bacterium]